MILVLILYPNVEINLWEAIKIIEVNDDDNDKVKISGVVAT